MFFFSSIWKLREKYFPSAASLRKCLQYLWLDWAEAGKLELTQSRAFMWMAGGLDA